MPLSEISDRWSILKLKIERLMSEDNAIVEQFGIFSAELNAELDKFQNGQRTKIEKEIQNLYEINGKIWDKEFDIRRGALGESNFEEVGRRALEIRKLNKLRIQAKNRIACMSLNTTMFEIKIQHASQ